MMRDVPGVHRTGSRALMFAMVSSLVLALTKYVFGLYTGSLILLWSAADSFSDAVVSGVNYFGFRWAQVPADVEHPFGHGKLESVLSTSQGALLLGVATSVAAVAIKTLFEGPRAPLAGLAAIVLAGSTAMAALLTFVLSNARRRTASIVLEADAAHYRMDLISGGAGVASLLAVRATGWVWIDAVASLAAAGWMLREAFLVVRHSLSELLDHALPESEQRAISRVLEAYAHRVVSFHGVRSRRSGPVRFVEVHVVLGPQQAFSDVHALVQELSEAIRVALPNSRVLVHPDAEGMQDDTDFVLEAGPKTLDLRT